MNIEGDYEIGYFVCVSVVLCVCVHVSSSSPCVVHNQQEWWLLPVKTFTLAEVCTLTSAF